MIIDVTGEGLYADPAKVIAIYIGDRICDTGREKCTCIDISGDGGKCSTFTTDVSPKEIAKNVNRALKIIEAEEKSRLEIQLQMIRELDI